MYYMIFYWLIAFNFGVNNLNLPVGGINLS